MALIFVGAFCLHSGIIRPETDVSVEAGRNDLMVKLSINSK